MALIIQLNGSNYVSPKTRTAFEQALESGLRVSAPAADPGTASASTGTAPMIVSSTPPAEIAPAAPAPDYGQLFQTLERGLAQAYEHQALTLHVHEQYLNYQAGYATLFAQLLQQQGAIFAGGAAGPQQAESAARVLESLSQSMARFHDLQSETLHVHRQFLEQQAGYSQACVQVLQQQTGLTHDHRIRWAPASPAPQGNPGSHDSHGGNGHTRGNGNGGNGNGHPRENAVPPIAVTRPIPPALPVDANVIPTIANPPARPNASAPQAAPAEPRPQPAPTSLQPAVDPAGLTQSLLAIVSDKTGYPPDTLDLTMDMEADLGIDSIKRVEILGTLREAYPTLPKFEPELFAELRTLEQVAAAAHARLTEARLPAVAPAAPTATTAPAASTVAAPAPASTLNLADLTRSLLAIVSDKTGYPPDTLDLTMDMEADLGIDSIKRVEILGTLREEYPNLPKFEPEVFAELRTLEQVAAAAHARLAEGVGNPKA